MIDTRILELATRLTEKAMGTDSTSVVWIGKEDQVTKFLTTTVKTLNQLYSSD